MKKTTLPTGRALWDRFRKLAIHCPSVGLWLDPSRMRFEESFLAEISGPMGLAFRRMAELERGAIANPDETRMVGHYWLRDPDRAPTAEIRDEIRGTLRAIKDFAAKVHAGKVAPQTAPRFRNLVVVGIGGSALGPQLANDALSSPRDPLKFYSVDNTDPDGIRRLLDVLGDGLRETLTVVISKSGGTKETRNGMLELAAAYKARDLDFSKHAVAVTGKESELEKTAKGWLAIFPMWDWVGGRTSELSAVGLVPAALQGLDIDALLDGARVMDAVTRVEDLRKNPAAMLAAMWYSAGDGKGQKDMVVLPYKDRLLLFSRYLQQLLMESLGKERDLDKKTVHQGIAVYGNKGSTDQHAYVQQLRDGVDNFFVVFIEVRRDLSDNARSLEVEPGRTSGDYLGGFLRGTREALTEGGRESVTISLDRFDAHELGKLIALFERAVGFYATLVNINAYHQPGVEAGKKAAEAFLKLGEKVLAELRNSGCKTRGAEEIAQAIGEGDRVEMVFHILERFAANPQDKGVFREPGADPFAARYGARIEVKATASA